MIFHPLQYPLARGLIAAHPDAELWYWRWDRYEAAYDATPRQRDRLEDLHLAASLRAAVNIVVSDALGDLAREEGGEPLLVPLAADSFPAPEPGAAVVAVSLGHLGHRTDWALLRAVAEGMPELVLLLIGAWHEAESGRDPDFQACRAAPNLVWLGRRSDEEAARLIQCADVGIVPFERSEFNDTALPYRIIKYARLGRRTITPDLKGVRTWDRAVTIADGPEAWIAALRASAGARTRPDLELREWALAQTAHAQNRPLWERLEALGIESGRLGLRAASAAAIRAEQAVPGDRLVARARDVHLRRRAGREAVAAQRLLAEREDLDAAFAARGRAGPDPRIDVPARVRDEAVGREGQRAAAHPGAHRGIVEQRRRGCRGWRG